MFSITIKHKTRLHHCHRHNRHKH